MPGSRLGISRSDAITRCIRAISDADTSTPSMSRESLLVLDLPRHSSVEQKEEWERRKTREWRGYPGVALLEVAVLRSCVVW